MAPLSFVLSPPAPFHPVVLLPPDTVVLDLREGWQPLSSPWSVGRYGEDRGIYTQALFAGVGERRSVHLGVDLGGPAGVPVHAPTEGVVVHAGYNAADGDYGHVVVTRHEAPIPGIASPWFLLFGHLSAASLGRSPVGRRVRAGAVLGWLGSPEENGGWPPHVHVQLGRMDPGTHDMPGACRPSARARMMHLFPDPAPILGRLPP